MIEVLKKYKKDISKLKPLQESAFIYNASRWQQLHVKAKEEVIQFEDKDISRKDIINAFQSYYINESSFLYPFVLTMIWGFADTGYGTYRTNKYLNNLEKIDEGMQALKENRLQDSFKSFMKIDGLNISYVSKLLYFGSRANKHPNYALIFDIRVARALVQLINPDIVGFLQIMPSKKYKDYEKYNHLIHNYAKELDVEAEGLEMFLFRSEF